MDEETLSPEVVEALRQQVVEEHPEMEGAELRVRRRRMGPEQAKIAAKLGLPAPKAEEGPHYVVTMTKEVPAEDGVIIPLVVRLTVDAQGCIVHGRERR